MTQRISGNAFRNTIISIDSYHNAVLCGTVNHPFYSAPVSFHSTIQLLKILETAFTETNYPQAYTSMRSFSKHAIAETCSPAESTGAIATFHVRVLFRQNSSWQGEVTWNEGGQSESFRSALELLFLMDSALQESAAKLAY